ncbi:MAG: ABC transporter substrate-binding protein [Oscillospiraceae bacterium]|nr:ABC transporter substrate-binding protein [Oscillospiraceae bacterium]
MKKFLAMLLALAMVFALAACGETAPAQTDTAPTDTTGTPADAAPAANDTPLVVGYDSFNSKFSPFFSETAYDQDVWAMTQISLLGNDRTGAIITKGIAGETVEYNGTPYTYYGPADLTITENDDGTVYYDFVMRDDLVFSDGEPVTIDDAIFSMYVLCDPTYDGNSSLFSVPIEGMEAYRSGMDSLANLIVAAGRDGYEENEFFTEEQYNAFWEDVAQAGAAFAQEIVDYCLANYADYGASDVASSAALWGFEIPADATAADFFDMMYEAYAGDLNDLSSTESAGSSLWSLMNDYDSYTVGVQTGESAPSITGIQKTGDYSMRIVLTEVDATAIYNLGVTVAPLHYYGDASLYDYDNNMFGFTKGDLSSVRAKTTQPVGAGPYKFVKFENGVVYFEANDLYFKGAPKTKYVNFIVCYTDDDKLNGVVTGTIDITDPSFSKDKAAQISSINGNDSINGDVITTSLVDNLGYGYIGMSANVINVDKDPASDASKALRKGLGTIFAVYRAVANDSYYGDAASVINYPISNTSWAAPRPADDGYKVAFSTDVDGNDIYTAGMTDEERYDAALRDALGWFEAAGYTVEDGKLTAAPKGASLEYTAGIPAGGNGDHPAFMILSEAKNALEKIGMTLIIKDYSDTSQIWTDIEAENIGIWTAAWGASLDPDMYQIYFSGDENHVAGGSNYMYDIDDAELNQLILDARASLDQTYRKAMYKACLDIIIDWAVEIPNYQRQNCVIFSTERVNLDTVTPDITTFYGWLSEIENIELN